MCRLPRILGLLALVCLIAPPALAQTPTVTAYFDQALTVRTMDCPGPVLDTLYVVAEGFNTLISAAEFLL